MLENCRYKDVDAARGEEEDLGSWWRSRWGTKEEKLLLGALLQLRRRGVIKGLQAGSLLGFYQLFLILANPVA